jgi:tetratricopeptide (TPR) repeat protein
MRTPEIIKAEIKPLLEEATNSKDPSRVAELFTKGCELSHQQAAKTDDPKTKAHLEGYALWLALGKFRRLTIMALQEKHFDEAGKHLSDFDGAVTELHRFLVAKVEAGLKLENIEKTPEEILAYGEEFDADFMVAQVASERTKSAALGPQIMEKVTSATKRYESLGKLEDVADCYQTLANFYEAIGDVDSQHRTSCTAADAYRQASEKEPLPEDERRRLVAISLDVRGLASVRYGGFLLARGRTDEAQRLYGKGAAELRESSELHARMGEVEDSQSAANLALLLDAMGRYVEALKGFREGLETSRAAGKLAEAKEILGKFDELHGGELFQVATFLIGMFDCQLNIAEMTKLQLQGDLNGAEGRYDRAVQAIERAKAHAPTDDHRRIAECVRETIDIERRLFAAERLDEGFDFNRAVQQFSEVISHCDEALKLLANSSDAEFAVISVPLVSYIKGLGHFALARQKHSSARRDSWTGKVKEASESVEQAILGYQDARSLLVGSDANGETIRARCVALMSEAEAFKRFLLEIHRYHPPRLRISVDAPDQCDIRKSFKLVMKLQNAGGEAATEVTCNLQLPEDFEATGATGMARQGSVCSWIGTMAGTETREFIVRLRAPAKPGLYSFNATCQQGGNLEPSLHEIEVLEPKIEKNLGGILKVSLTEPVLFWFKVAGYPISIILGAIGDRLVTHFWR